MRNKKTKLYTEIHKNIYKIRLPFPGILPGPVNVYLFLGEQITLVDTGITNTTGYLKKALGTLGLKFADIDQVVITHGHIDHYGAARNIVDGSGGKTKVISHSADVRLIETGHDVTKDRQVRFVELMGVPYFHKKCMELIRSSFRLFVRNCRVDRALNDNDIIRLGDYEGRVMHTPGHSKGSICIFLEKEGFLFAGDNILGHITPNALVMLDQVSNLPERRSQEEYYNSLAKLEQLGQPMVFTGHGRDVKDLNALISSYRNQFKERQDAILKELKEDGDTVYRIARHVFSDIRWFDVFVHIYLAISEVFTHVQVHEKENRIITDIVNNTYLLTKNNKSQAKQ